MLWKSRRAEQRCWERGVQKGERRWQLSKDWRMWDIISLRWYWCKGLHAWHVGSTGRRPIRQAITNENKNSRTFWSWNAVTVSVPRWMRRDDQNQDQGHGDWSIESGQSVQQVNVYVCRAIYFRFIYIYIWILDGEDLLEKEITTHSGIFAWRIPWTEEPGRLQSIGSQKSQTQFSD